MGLETEIFEKVRATISEYRMLDKGDRVVVGVSGGPDSVALLYVLSSLKDEFDLNLHAAHLNHCLRGKEAEGDALFVADLAKKLKIPHIIEKIDVRTGNKTQGSLETWAREQRYEFFLKVARGLGAAKVALGHQADDVIETILMHLIRGSGAGGLSGIPPLRRLSKEVVLIRPLISIWAAEIENYLKDKGIPSRFDSSNLDPAHLRNRIRHELIPGLLEYNPGFRRSLTRSLNLWCRDDNYLRCLANEALEDVLLEKSKGKIVFSLNKFNIYDPSIGFRLIREGLNLLKGNLEGITYSHIEAIAALIQDGPSQGQLNLPCGISVQREYDQLVLYEDKGGKREEGNFFEHSVNLPGQTRIPQLNLVLDTEVLSADEFTLDNLREFSTDISIEVYLDYGRIMPPLSLRPRRKGDRFLPLGMEGAKKIKDFFIDLKIPSALRDQIPLLVDRDRIIWVLGYRIDERMKVTKGTKQILKVSYRKGR